MFIRTQFWLLQTKKKLLGGVEYWLEKKGVSACICPQYEVIPTFLQQLWIWITSTWVCGTVKGNMVFRKATVKGRVNTFILLEGNRETLSLCLSIMKSISCWKWNSKGSVPKQLLFQNVVSREFAKWLMSRYDSDRLRGKMGINVRILNKACSEWDIKHQVKQNLYSGWYSPLKCLEKQRVQKWKCY